MVFTLLYNVVLGFLMIFALPVILFQRIRFGKYKNSLLQRLGLFSPSFTKKEGEKLVWIHTISMGETRAAIPFYQKIKSEYPHAKIVISTVTETGQIEAKKSMSSADAHFYMPVDFSFTMKKLMKRIQPDIVVLTESDFWYQFLFQAKKQGAKTLLINGKLSERSFNRFKKARFFFTKFLSCLDKICVQSSEYALRFELLGASTSKIAVTGNIKLDASLPEFSEAQKRDFRSELGIGLSDFVLTVGSTHDPEEEQILLRLEKIWDAHPCFKVILVPRHPERFTEVEDLLKRMGISYSLYSQRAEKQSSRVILIDSMGVLLCCYQIADLAVVCGSFADKVGGHNIFEPILLGVPVFFGPYMYSQRDLRDLVKLSGSGKQVSIDELYPAIASYIVNPQERKTLRENGLVLREEVKGALEKTWRESSSIFKEALN